MKAAPLYNVLKNSEFAKPILIHTGQHYDYEMSEAFFSDFKLPKPFRNLDVGSGTHAEQTAKIMTRFENVLKEIKPELVIVFGDVNSTIACSLTAKKLGVPVAHVEAGLRSFDEGMPEEINRKLTDCISDLLFTHCQDADDNLRNEGIKNIENWDSFQISKKPNLKTLRPISQPASLRLLIPDLFPSCLMFFKDRIEHSGYRRPVDQTKIVRNIQERRNFFLCFFEEIPGECEGIK